MSSPGSSSLLKLRAGVQLLSKCHCTTRSTHILHIRTNVYQLRLITTTNRRSNGESFKNRLQDYIEGHKYNLAAMEAARHKFRSETSSAGPGSAVSESFCSTSSNWAFRWFDPILHSTTRKFDVDGKKVEVLIPSIACTSRAIFEKGYTAIYKYVNGQDLEPPVFTAVKTLERFFQEKGDHQRSLAHLKTLKTETPVAALLGHHFLSQLLPYQSNYFLDNRSKFKPDCCPCGCGEPINYGMTHLGSPVLFHGYADIVLFPTNKDLFLGVDKSTSAVFTIRKNRSAEYGHKSIKDDSDKRFNADISLGECEKISSGDDTSALRQLCKQAISTSFCKYKKIHFNHVNNTVSEQNNVSMIPVCVITKDSYEVAVYDAEYDYLLKSDPLQLFKNASSTILQFSAVVDLWMLINHSLFCTQPHLKTLDKLRGTCNLIPQLGQKKFDSVVINSEWLLQPDCSETIPLKFSSKEHPINLIVDEEYEYDFLLKKYENTKGENEEKLL